MAKLVTLLSILLATVPFSVAQLAILAQLAGKQYFGAAAENPGLTDGSYVAQLGNTLDFHQLTPVHSMEWDATEPSRGTFTFNAGDAIVAQAKARGQLMRGHSCVWHKQLPEWATAGNFDNATLLSIVESHCGTLVGHYRGQILSWDIINEAFNDDGTFRQTLFFNTTGTAYIKVALRAARAADPVAKLYINDFNVEGTGAKSAAIANFIKELKDEGVPIDGVGVQSRLIVGGVPSTMRQNLQNLVDLGLEVALTELDIQMTLPETPDLIMQQTKDYETVISACKAVDGCVGVTLWNWTDKFFGTARGFTDQSSPFSWDENFNKKPAYMGIVKGWLAQ